MVKADSEDLNEYLVNINATFCHFGNLEMEARWDYITDITTAHEKKMVLTYYYQCWKFFFNSLWFGVQLLNFQNDARLVFQELKKTTTQKLSQFDLDQETDEIKRMAKFYKSLGNNLTRKQLNEVYTISA